MRRILLLPSLALALLAVPARAAQSPPPSLKRLKVPKPANLADFVRDEGAAVALGKAFFWDMQAGSDGIVACASCHYQAGVDNRSRNTLAPGFNKAFEKGGPNSQLRLGQFPFHVFADPTDRFSRVLSDSDDIVGSQGVVKANFGGIVLGNPAEPGTSVADPVFNVNGVNARQVMTRNTSSMINSALLFRLPWDGKFNHFFNGASGFGARDPNAKILVDDGAGLQEAHILLD